MEAMRDRAMAPGSRASRVPPPESQNRLISLMKHSIPLSIRVNTVHLQ